MMGFGGQRLPTKIVAILVVLVALWSYAAYLTGRDALDLLQLRTLGESLGQPTDRLIFDLQAERRLTLTALGDPGQPRAQLVAQRVRTDEAAAALRLFDQDADPRLVAAGAVRERADALVRHLDGIGPLRQNVDNGRLNRGPATDAYDELIDAGFAIYGARWSSRDSDLIDTTRAMVALARAREILAREDSVVAGALASDRMTAEDQRLLVELVATQRFARTEAAAGLPETERGAYQQLIGGPSFAGLLALEERLVHQDPTGGRAAVKAPDWQAATGPALTGLRDLVTNGIRDGVARSTPGAVELVVRTGLVVGLGLVVMLAAIAGSIRTTRSLAARLGQLRATAEELVERELPAVARQLRRGEPVQAPAELPAPKPDADQLDQLGRAIGVVRAAAVRAVLTAAGPRNGAWDLFLQLTQRNQTLLRDQLNLLDAMERREADTEELADLFRIDHLATQVRRNVEKLITLAGATPARRWRRPVPLLDVVRGAVAEVADYRRVLVAPTWTGALAGPMVPDVIHLLAELIENGLAYSTTNTTVRVTGEPREGGYAIIITDDGPGLSGPALAAANELLRDPPSVRPPGTGHGLYAVGLIARRRGIEVELWTSPRGGMTAVVVLPASQLVATPGTGADGSGQRTAEYSHLAGAAAPTRRSDQATATRGTPDGLPIRARQPPNGYETMEIPIARSAGDQPETFGLSAGKPTVGHGPSTHPTRTGSRFNGSERTTSGSAAEHNR